MSAQSVRRASLVYSRRAGQAARQAAWHFGVSNGSVRDVLRIAHGPVNIQLLPGRFAAGFEVHCGSYC